MKLSKFASTFFMGISGLLLASQSAVVMAAPATIVLIRHAEKPAVGDILNAQGEARAALLPPVFLHQFGPPVAVYAMAPHGVDGTQRPILTVTPLVQLLQETDRQLPFITTFEKKDAKGIADSILNNPDYDDKLVLICWEHDAITDVAEALGAPAKDLPNKWHGEVFNRAWVLELDPSKDKHAYKDFYQVDLDVLMPNNPVLQGNPSDPQIDQQFPIKGN